MVIPTTRSLNARISNISIAKHQLCVNLDGDVFHAMKARNHKIR